MKTLFAATILAATAALAPAAAQRLPPTNILTVDYFLKFAEAEGDVEIWSRSDAEALVREHPELLDYRSLKIAGAVVTTRPDGSVGVGVIVSRWIYATKQYKSDTRLEIMNSRGRDA